MRFNYSAYDNIIQVGMALGGAAAIVIVFLRTLKDKSADHLKQASSVWNDLYHSTKAQLDEMKEQHRLLNEQITKCQAIIESQAKTIAEQAVQIAAMRAEHEKEKQILKRTIAETEKVVEEKIVIINELRATLDEIKKNK